MPGPLSSTSMRSHAAFGRGADHDLIAVAHGVRDEVGDGALEGLALQRQHQVVAPLSHLELDRRAVDLRLVVDLLEQLAQVGGLGLLAAVAARKRQIVLEHVLHLVDVGLERLHLGPVAHEGELELEAGEDGPQVVADAGEHGRCAARRAA